MWSKTKCFPCSDTSWLIHYIRPAVNHFKMAAKMCRDVVILLNTYLYFCEFSSWQWAVVSLAVPQQKCFSKHTGYFLCYFLFEFAPTGCVREVALCLKGVWLPGESVGLGNLQKHAGGTIKYLRYFLFFPFPPGLLPA